MNQERLFAQIGALFRAGGVIYKLVKADQDIKGGECVQYTTHYHVAPWDGEAPIAGAAVSGAINKDEFGWIIVDNTSKTSEKPLANSQIFRKFSQTLESGGGKEGPNC